MLAMGRAIMARPALLMLDEPSLGLAPRIVARGVSAPGRAARDAACRSCWSSRTRAPHCEVADYAYVLELGTITKHGPAAEIANDERLIESYLGLGGTEY